MLGASQERQLIAARAAAGRQAKTAKVLSEVASGHQTLQKRQAFMQSIESGEYQQVFCESARAIARNVAVQEAIFDACQRRGVQIVPHDAPGLFNLNPTPGESLLRRVMGCVQQYDRDNLVDRLKRGRDMKGAREACESRPRRTQGGKIKATLRKCLLQPLQTTFWQHLVM